MPVFRFQCLFVAYYGCGLAIAMHAIPIADFPKHSCQSLGTFLDFV